MLGGSTKREWFSCFYIVSLNLIIFQTPTGLSTRQLSLLISSLLFPPALVIVNMQGKKGWKLSHLALPWLLESSQTLQPRNIMMGEVTWLWWPVAPGLRRLSPCWSLLSSSARNLSTFTSLLRMIYMTAFEMLWVSPPATLQLSRDSLCVCPCNLHAKYMQSMKVIYCANHSCKALLQPFYKLQDIFHIHFACMNVFIIFTIEFCYYTEYGQKAVHGFWKTILQCFFVIMGVFLSWTCGPGQFGASLTSPSTPSLSPMRIQRSGRSSSSLVPLRGSFCRYVWSHRWI